MRRLHYVLALVCVLAAGGSGPAVAQHWPEKPITIIMGFPAGSGVDVIARSSRTRWRRTSAPS